MLNILLLLPFVVPMFLYLLDVLPNLDSRPSLIPVSEHAIESSSTLMGGIHSNSWDAANLSVVHDLLLPFSTSGLANLLQALIYMPFVLFALLQPFWQAGILGVVNATSSVSVREHHQFRRFFEGIGRWGIACFGLSLFLLPFWLATWRLISSLSSVVTSRPWTLNQSVILWGATIFSSLFMLLSISLVGDMARLRFQNSSPQQKPNPVRILPNSFFLVARHFLPLSIIRVTIYLLSLLTIMALSYGLGYWKVVSTAGLIGAFIIQQMLVITLIWSRIASLSAMAAYVRNYVR